MSFIGYTHCFLLKVIYSKISLEFEKRWGKYNSNKTKKQSHMETFFFSFFKNIFFFLIKYVYISCLLITIILLYMTRKNNN